MRIALVSALALVIVTACGAGDPTAVGGSTREEQPSESTSADEPAQLLEGNGTVLDAADGPELCLGGVLLSLPPQCGGIPIANWDWGAVEGEETRGGTTWGGFHVVGTYDGQVFTVSETGPPTSDSQDLFPYESPCPEPEGGWKVADPEQSTQNDVGPARAYARSQPDYIISFADHLEPEREEFGPVVFVAAFRGDVERHEAEIRKRWNGPLCVVARDLPTDDELERIRTEVENRLPELGLVLLGSATGGFEPAVVIDVVADPGGRAQALVDEEYGEGLVRFVPALRPVGE